MKQGAIKDAKAFLEGNFNKYFTKITEYRTDYVLLEVLKEAPQLCGGPVTAPPQVLTPFCSGSWRMDTSGPAGEQVQTTSRRAHPLCLRLQEVPAGAEPGGRLYGRQHGAPGGLTALLFNRCKEYALMDSKPTQRRVLPEHLMTAPTAPPWTPTATPVITSVRQAFWRNAVMADYGSLVDMGRAGPHGGRGQV